MAGTGPIPMIPGSTPAAAAPSTFARGFNPNSSAFSLDMMTNAAAPSFLPDAFPAVTVPSGKIGFKTANWSRLVDRFGYSSTANTIGSPFLCGRITGTISSENLLLSIAAIAFRWLANANSSCSCLDTLYCLATVSAV